MAFELSLYLKERACIVDARLKQILASLPPGRLSEAMTYSVLTKGKRLRPILCLAASEAVGGAMERVLNVACAMELIHAFSLIHDDLPAMDNDDLRRGKPTCHKAFDEATAILAGDALLSHALFLIISLPVENGGQAATLLDVASHIADAVGCHGITGGQMEDILGETRSMTLAELEAMHAKKTGALIEASLYAGAVLGNGKPADISALTRYGNYLGLAFQVTDDILNIEGDPKTLGKAVGTDVQRNKTTHPALMGLEKAKAYAGGLVEAALQALEGFDKNADPLRAIAGFVITRQK